MNVRIHLVICIIASVIYAASPVGTRLIALMIYQGMPQVKHLMEHMA